MTVTVKVEGLRELDFALSELPKATARNSLQRNLKKGAVKVQEAWEPKVPVLTGRLKHSIVVGPSSKLTPRQKKDAKKEGKYFAEMHVGTADPAGIQTEFGNVHQAAEPAGRPAWDATKDTVLADFGHDMWTDIDKVRARVARKAARLASSGE